MPTRNLHLRPTFWGLDRDLKDVLDTIESTWEGSRSSTLTNYKETEEGYFFSLEIPGVSKSNLEISFEGDKITIEGVKRSIFSQDTEEKISRVLTIPEKVAKDQIKAHYEDGVLYFALPKMEEEKPVKINFTDGQDNVVKQLMHQEEGVKSES
jgi:HSP20 family molecular chaperone IbpA